jgi:hypothetical protein
MIKHQAIFNIHSNVTSIIGETCLDKDGNIVSVNVQLVEAELTRLKSEYDSKEYQRLRVKEYPSMQEQLDMQYWDSINGTTTWQDAINAVKAKYPKPEGV